MAAYRSVYDHDKHSNETEEEVSLMQTVISPRAKRMHSLRRLVQRAEDVLQSADPARSGPSHREPSDVLTLSTGDVCV